MEKQFYVDALTNSQTVINAVMMEKTVTYATQVIISTKVMVRMFVEVAVLLETVTFVQLMAVNSVKTASIVGLEVVLDFPSVTDIYFLTLRLLLYKFIKEFIIFYIP